mmetsp:Transcript_42633/g.109683  ORF Transcript_42633/g.109683 Transcript_42633/m.109683 type:complete len:1455 (-) Transcript_42633:408-4772(-)
MRDREAEEDIFPDAHGQIFQQLQNKFSDPSVSFEEYRIHCNEWLWKLTNASDDDLPFHLKLRACKWLRTHFVRDRREDEEDLTVTDLVPNSTYDTICYASLLWFSFCDQSPQEQCPSTHKMGAFYWWSWMHHLETILLHDVHMDDWDDKVLWWNVQFPTPVLQAFLEYPPWVRACLQYSRQRGYHIVSTFVLWGLLKDDQVPSPLKSQFLSLYHTNVTTDECDPSLSGDEQENAGVPPLPSPRLAHSHRRERNDELFSRLTSDLLQCSRRLSLCDQKMLIQSFHHVPFFCPSLSMFLAHAPLSRPFHPLTLIEDCVRIGCHPGHTTFTLEPSPRMTPSHLFETHVLVPVLRQTKGEEEPGSKQRQRTKDDGPLILPEEWWRLSYSIFLLLHKKAPIETWDPAAVLSGLLSFSLPQQQKIREKIQDPHFPHSFLPHFQSVSTFVAEEVSPLQKEDNSKNTRWWVRELCLQFYDFGALHQHPPYQEFLRDSLLYHHHMFWEAPLVVLDGIKQGFWSQKDVSQFIFWFREKYKHHRSLSPSREDSTETLFFFLDRDTQRRWWESAVRCLSSLPFREETRASFSRKSREERKNQKQQSRTQQPEHQTTETEGEDEGEGEGEKETKAEKEKEKEKVSSFSFRNDKERFFFVWYLVRYAQLKDFSYATFLKEQLVRAPQWGRSVVRPIWLLCCGNDEREEEESCLLRRPQNDNLELSDMLLTETVTYFAIEPLRNSALDVDIKTDFIRHLYLSMFYRRMQKGPFFSHRLRTFVVTSMECPSFAHYASFLGDLPFPFAGRRDDPRWSRSLRTCLVRSPPPPFWFLKEHFCVLVACISEALSFQETSWKDLLDAAEKQLEEHPLLYQLMLETLLYHKTVWNHSEFFADILCRLRGFHPSSLATCLPSPKEEKKEKKKKEKEEEEEEEELKFLQSLFQRSRSDSFSLSPRTRWLLDACLWEIMSFIPEETNLTSSTTTFLVEGNRFGADEGLMWWSSRLVPRERQHFIWSLIDVNKAWVKRVQTERPLLANLRTWVAELKLIWSHQQINSNMWPLYFTALFDVLRSLPWSEAHDEFTSIFGATFLFWHQLSEHTTAECDELFLQRGQETLEFNIPAFIKSLEDVHPHSFPRKLPPVLAQRHSLDCFLCLDLCPRSETFFFSLLREACSWEWDTLSKSQEECPSLPAWRDQKCRDLLWRRPISSAAQQRSPKSFISLWAKCVEFLFPEEGGTQVCLDDSVGLRWNMLLLPGIEQVQDTSRRQLEELVRWWQFYSMEFEEEESPFCRLVRTVLRSMWDDPWLVNVAISHDWTLFLDACPRDAKQREKILSSSASSLRQEALSLSRDGANADLSLINGTASSETSLPPKLSCCVCLEENAVDRILSCGHPICLTCLLRTSERHGDLLERAVKRAELPRKKGGREEKDWQLRCKELTFINLSSMNREWTCPFCVQPILHIQKCFWLS